MSSEVAWYAARAGGLVAYVVLTTGMVVGIALAGHKVRRLPRFAVEDVHRFLGLLAGVFISIHIAGILLDTVVPFSLAQVLIPFTADYRPLTTGLGIVAMEVLVALALTNRFRRKLPHRVWRTLHGLNFVVWVLASAHGVLTGTDRDQVWVQALYAVSAAAVVGALVWRLRGARLVPSAFGEAALPGLLVAAGMVVLALISMPAAPTASTVTSSTTLAVGSLPFSGRIEQTEGQNAQLVSVVGTDSEAPGASLRIDVLRTSTETTTSLQVLSARGAVCHGTVAALTTDGFSGSCQLAGEQATHTIKGTWQISGETVKGTVSVDGGSSSPSV
jgi:methionine sulfoxide reductase heme-binding subunit